MFFGSIRSPHAVGKARLQGPEEKNHLVAIGLCAFKVPRCRDNGLHRTHAVVVVGLHVAGEREDVEVKGRDKIRVEESIRRVYVRAMITSRT